MDESTSRQVNDLSVNVKVNVNVNLDYCAILLNLAIAQERKKEREKEKKKKKCAPLFLCARRRRRRCRRVYSDCGALYESELIVIAVCVCARRNRLPKVLEEREKKFFV